MRRVRAFKRELAVSTLVGVAAAVAACSSGTVATASQRELAAAGPLTASSASLEQVLRGRQLVISSGCGDCHGGVGNPAATGWLAGRPAEQPTAQLGQYRIWARNLTPDENTGLGRFSEQQIFNALRYGLRPGETPDVEITSATPGEGNHPADPRYLSPGMPWPFIRCQSDRALRDIAAYLKHGLRPVSHQVPESQRPPDSWASEFTPDKLGSCEAPAFPAAQEQPPPDEKREQVLRGRALAAGCAVCHGGANSADNGFLAGFRELPADTTRRFTFVQEYRLGPFRTRPRNLTPDNATGLGRFTERQIFNALRYGLRPGETPDVDITSTTPGEGNHPQYPKYLAPPMPWPVFRHMSDQQLRDIAAYLKHGLKPASNRVADSDGPPDFWASIYTPELIGPYPAPPFPTANERAPATPGEPSARSPQRSPARPASSSVADSSTSTP